MCEKTDKIKETELIKLLETKFNADFGNATLKTLRKVLKTYMTLKLNLLYVLVLVKVKKRC